MTTVNKYSNNIPEFTYLTQRTNGQGYGTEGYNPEYQPQGELNYHQASLERQKSTPKFGIPAQEDMDTVLAFQNGRIPKTNPFETKIASAKSGQFDGRGKLWEGFGVQPYNGLGEVIPTYSPDEHLINTFA